MALLNTVANSAPMVAITKAASTSPTDCASPGRPSHSAVVPITRSTPNDAIHGLRRPLESATAPSTGDSSAMHSPAALVA